MPIIQTDSLTKTFGDTIAVDNIHMQVEAGEIYGCLGLNGAGKTTTIRMLLSMIKPSKGSVWLFGKPLHPDTNLWNEVGYLVETTYAYPNLSVHENMEVYFRYRNLKDKNLIKHILEKLQLTKYQSTKAKHLSLGNLQRLGLAKALFHQPKLLILDEPTNGLDPAGIVEIRQLLKELSSQGVTIFLSSHILGEIAKLATRIGIIHEGRLIKEFYTNQLGEDLNRKLLIETQDNFKAAKVLTDKGYHPAIHSHQYLALSDERIISTSEEIATLLVGAGLPPKQLYLYEENLETYFLRIIGMVNNL